MLGIWIFTGADTVWSFDLCTLEDGAGTDCLAADGLDVGAAVLEVPAEEEAAAELVGAAGDAVEAGLP